MVRYCNIYIMVYIVALCYDKDEFNIVCISNFDYKQLQLSLTSVCLRYITLVVPLFAGD